MALSIGPGLRGVLKSCDDWLNDIRFEARDRRAMMSAIDRTIHTYGALELEVGLYAAGRSSRQVITLLSMYTTLIGTLSCVKDQLVLHGAPHWLTEKVSGWMMAFRAEIESLALAAVQAKPMMAWTQKAASESDARSAELYLDHATPSNGV